MSKTQHKRLVTLPPRELGHLLEKLLAESSSSSNSGTGSGSGSESEMNSWGPKDKGAWTTSGRPRRQEWACKCGRGNFWDRAACRSCGAPHSGRPVHSGVETPPMPKEGPQAERWGKRKKEASAEQPQKKPPIAKQVKDAQASVLSLELALDALGDGEEHEELRTKLQQDLDAAREQSQDPRPGGAKWDSAKATVEKKRKKLEALEEEADRIHDAMTKAQEELAEAEKELSDVEAEMLVAATNSPMHIALKESLTGLDRLEKVILTGDPAAAPSSPDMDPQKLASGLRNQILKLQEMVLGQLQSRQPAPPSPPKLDKESKAYLTGRFTAPEGVPAEMASARGSTEGPPRERSRTPEGRSTPPPMPSPDKTADAATKDVAMKDTEAQPGA